MASSSSSVEEQSAKKMIRLQSSDGETFIVDENVAILCTTLRNCIQDGAGDFFSLRNVNAKIMAVVMEYCKIHASDQVEESRKNEFDAELVNKDVPTMIKLVQAAKYLCIQDLIDLLGKGVAEQIKDMTVEQVREIFGIENDFTPEEEQEAIRKESAWPFNV